MRLLYYDYDMIISTILLLLGFWGTVKVRVGNGWGVPSTELLVIALSGGGFLSILGAQYLIFNKIQQLFVNLDHQLAATIGKLLEELPIQGGEQTNPIQAMIIQALAGQMKPPPVEIIPPKDEKGLFR